MSVLSWIELSSPEWPACVYVRIAGQRLTGYVVCSGVLLSVPRGNKWCCSCCLHVPKYEERHRHRWPEQQQRNENKAPDRIQVQKLKLWTKLLDYLKYACVSVAFRLINSSLCYWSLPSQYHQEASGVVIGPCYKLYRQTPCCIQLRHQQSSRRCYTGCCWCHAHPSKTNSVPANQPVVRNRLRIVNLNCKRLSFVVTLERTTWFATISTTTPIWRLKLERCKYNRQDLSNELSKGLGDCIETRTM